MTRAEALLNKAGIAGPFETDTTTNEAVDVDRARRDLKKRLNELDDALKGFMKGMDDDTSILIQAMPGGFKAVREISKASGEIEDNIRHLNNQLMNAQNWNHKMLEGADVFESRDMAKAFGKYEGQVFRDGSNKSVVEFDAHGFIVEDEKTGKLIGIEYKNLEKLDESLSEAAKITPVVQKVLNTIQELRDNSPNLEQFQLSYQPSGYHTGKAIENALKAGLITSNGRSSASLHGHGAVMVELTPAGEKAIESIFEGLSAKDQEKAEFIRDSAPGYVGMDFAKKASDEDLIAMSDLNDEKGAIYNMKIKPIHDQIDRLRKKYRLKPVKR